MNKSLTEFLQKQQSLMAAGHTIEEPKRVGILDKIGRTIRGLVPSPIKDVIGISQERDLYITDRDYHMSVEYDRLKDVGLSPQEAQKSLTEGVDFSFGSFGARINTSFIPEKYREAYSQSKAAEIKNILTFSTLAALGKSRAVKRDVGEKLVLKYGDRAAAQIINKGTGFAEGALKKGGEAMVKKAGIRAPDFFGAKITPEVIKEVKRTIPIISKAVKEQGLKNLPAIQEGQKVSTYVAKLIREGKLNPDQSPVLKSLAKKYNMVDNKGRVILEELADQLELFTSEGGKTLNVASQWGRQLHTELSKMGIKTIAPNPTTWDRILAARRGYVNLWRSALVSNLRVGMRNIGEFGYRYTMGMVDKAMQAAEVATIKATRKKFGVAVSKKLKNDMAAGPLIDDIMAISKALSPKARAALNKVLDESPVLKQKLWSFTAADIASGNKVTNLLSTFTRLQSKSTRTVSMMARMSNWARKSGKDVAQLKPKDVPINELRKGIDDAIAMDLMAQPTSPIAKSILKIFHDIPELNLITYAFPRYMMNAIRVIYEYSPASFAKLFSPKFISKLAGGEGHRAAWSSINKSIIGTTQYAIAHHLRNSEYAGEKWHEIKIGDKTYDTKWWGPVIPAYMFLAEAVKTDGQKFGPRDWIEGLSGINRLAGQELFLISLFTHHEDGEAFKKAFQGWAGQHFGGFGQPFMNFKALTGMFSDEERHLRYTKEDPWLGPFKAKVPWLNQTLPQQPTMTREGTYEIERFDPVLAQMTGLPRKEKNYLEAEIDRLGIKEWQLRPKTGDAWLDRKLIEGTGTFMQPINDAMEKHPNYKMLEDRAKEDLIRTSISEAKKMAKQKFFAEYEDEIIDHYTDNMRPMKKEERVEYIESLKNKKLLPVNIQKKLLEQIELFSS